MKRRPWKRKEIAYLKANFPDHYTAQIAAHLGRSYKSIVGQARDLGLKKSDAFFAREHALQAQRLRETGQHARFQKGMTPVNKGQKMPPELYERVKATMFQKGLEPHNTAPEGDRTVRIRRDKKKRDYYYIRARMGVWLPLHRYVWEHFNGPIPEGMIVVFRDGHTLNCHPDNLMLIDRQQHVRRNHCPQKAAQTIRQGEAKASFYASRLFLRNRDLARFALEHAPELIEAKRAQIKLKNQIQTNPV